MSRADTDKKVTREHTLEVSRMSCGSCVGRVERALQAVDGVSAVAVNLATESAVVSARADVSLDTLKTALAAAGYPVKPRNDLADNVSRNASREQERHEELQTLTRSFFIAALLSLPVIVLEMGSHLIPALQELLHNTLGHQNNWLLQFALTTALLIGPGRRFFNHGIPALLRLEPDMNSLVVLGTSAAWGFSAVATFAPALLPSGTVNVYYEAAAVIITLILLGRVLEARAKGRTSEAISRLLRLQAHTARVERNGQQIEVAINDINPGERVQVRPGERVPLDGELIDGNSYVDESMITGESMPVTKHIGSPVTGGTLNKTGAFTMRVSRLAGDTVLAQIIKMVEAAQASKLPIQSLVDKITLWFVPAVMLVALLTVVVWMIWGPEPALTLALVNAVAVLIVACPCAMGLATPVSIMVGTGRAAEMGILFRDGAALQALRDTRIIALDKTGTITNGTPELTDFLVQPGFDEAEVLALVAAVESRSEHPIAEALSVAAQSRKLNLPSITQFEALPGYGMQAEAGNRQIHIGADRLLKKMNIDTSATAYIASALADQGKTPFYAAIDGKLAAVIAVADTIKATTPAAINALHKLGFRVVMISGDNQRTAQSVAQQLSIDEVFAEVLPEGKVAVLQQLGSDGSKVTYVGDGINDAPALAAADIGIAMGNGTDVAIESAAVVLMAGDLTAVVNAVALARSTMRNIHQNLFWAFAYNVALIPVAAGALYPAFGLLLAPIFAAGAMAMSSVFVLGNALRLKRFSSAEFQQGMRQEVHQEPGSATMDDLSKSAQL